MLPSITSTDKSVCATLILPSITSTDKSAYATLILPNIISTDKSLCHIDPAELAEMLMQEEPVWHRHSCLCW
jgi:hypothetical protein